MSLNSLLKVCEETLEERKQKQVDRCKQNLTYFHKCYPKLMASTAPYIQVQLELLRNSTMSLYVNLTFNPCGYSALLDLANEKLAGALERLLTNVEDAPKVAADTSTYLGRCTHSHTNKQMHAYLRAIAIMLLRGVPLFRPLNDRASVESV